jgi:hypothetical protein
MKCTKRKIKHQNQQDPGMVKVDDIGFSFKELPELESKIDQLEKFSKDILSRCYKIQVNSAI